MISNCLFDLKGLENIATKGEFFSSCRTTRCYKIHSTAKKSKISNKKVLPTPLWCHIASSTYFKAPPPPKAPKRLSVLELSVPSAGAPSEGAAAGVSAAPAAGAASAGAAPSALTCWLTQLFMLF